MDREKSGCDTVENSGCGEEKGRGHREVAVVIVTATTFQVTERSFPLVALVCEMAAIPTRRNRPHVYTVGRLIVVYVQLLADTAESSVAAWQSTQYPEGGVPAWYSSCKLWTSRRRASFRDFGRFGFDMSRESTRILA